MAEEKIFTSAKDLKVGKYVLVDGVPCKVVSIDISKPGKHGSAKMRVVAIGIFDGSKKVFLTPSDGEVEVPIITKKDAQVLSVAGDSVQVMDSQTYETYYLPIPDELKGQITEGSQVELMEAMGSRSIVRIKG